MSIENIDYHINCMNEFEKKMQDGQLTDEEITNYKEHQRIYRVLKDQLINPTRYRVEMTNTLTGHISYTTWYNTHYEATRLRDDYIDSDIYPYMLFRVVSSLPQ